MTVKTLLPCPFCGEQCAILVIDQGDKWAHYEPDCLEVRTGYNLASDAEWRAKAINAWNTRTREAALLARIAGLENCIDEADKLCAATMRLVETTKAHAALTQRKP